jgi:small subunit ribosomal protein S21
MAASNIHPSIGDECVQILVRDNNVDQALKVLKKKMQREGIFREMKLRGHYEKPSERKAREKAEAVRRARKLARKRAQREGLVPMKPKPVDGTAVEPGNDGPEVSIELIVQERLDRRERAEPIEILMLALRKAHEALGFAGKPE